MRFLVVGLLLGMSVAASAQDRAAPSPFDDRGGLPVPETVEDLKNLTLDFWLKFRRTNQAAYNYINEAADFRAYQYVCKRHQLNIDIEPLTLLSKQYVKQVIPAHFTEPEIDIVNSLKDDAQTAFFEDMAGDVMSFEYGNRIAQQDTKIRDSGESKMTFCQDVETTYKEKYVALLATAQRRLK
ncbi:hypothetical protein KFE96_15820 [Kordiimonas sp. SCSIO 12603]|uniref:hypothetical protein n=1 Tax=Kordiimonas sp. SCSIO 12603 TaxID=2829596 RepID=UPI002106CA1C|nr:hypothetical protein [Kordiimonas sp. SCSIO 12603]UTW58274.1 hypothetical protein KFE96_15820 [Kordiimonas sp. SCSIO 12603]